MTGMGPPPWLKNMQGMVVSLPFTIVLKKEDGN